MRLTADEHATLVANAAAAGQRPATFLRTLGVGHTPTSVIDAEHIIELIRLRGDLGRAGGLLKLWLSDDARATVRSDVDLRVLVQEIADTQAEVRRVIERLEAEM